jgi:large subunit ribosomal protein L13
MKVIDATGIPLGRLSALLAKRLLDGEEIAVINAEKAVIVGRRREIEKRYQRKREVGGTKRKGPFFPRMPDQILKRTVRGMLPYQQPRGRAALKNLKTYIGIPEQFRESSTDQLGETTTSPHITLQDLSNFLGVTW